MKRTKSSRLLAFLLIVVMLLAMVPGTAFAAGEADPDSTEAVQNPDGENTNAQLSAEAQAFIDAVNAIPELTEDNVEAYNEAGMRASELYDVVPAEELASPEVMAAVETLRAAMDALTGGATPTDRDYVVNIYAVVINDSGKIIAVNSIPTRNFSGTTSSPFSTDGQTSYQWTANGNGYTASGPGQTNVNSTIYAKWPEYLWNYSGYNYVGIKGGLVYTPYVNGSVGSYTEPGYSWQYEKNRGVGYTSYYFNVANATGSAIWYIFKAKSVNYTVQWIDAADNTVLKSESRSGSVGSTVSVGAGDKSYAGYEYAGDSYPGTVLSATLASSGTVLKMYFNKKQTDPVLESGHVTVKKVFSGITDKSKIPDNLVLTYMTTAVDAPSYTHTETLKVDSAEFSTDSNGNVVISWGVQNYFNVNESITVTEKGYDIEGYDCPGTSYGPMQLGENGGRTITLTNTYTPKTPKEEPLTINKHVSKIADRTFANAAEFEAAKDSSGKVYYEMGDEIEWTITIHNPNEESKKVSLGESPAYNDVNGTGNSVGFYKKLKGDITYPDQSTETVGWANSTNVDVTVPEGDTVIKVSYTTSMEDVKDGLRTNAYKLFNHVVIAGYTVNGESKSASTDSEPVWLKEPTPADWDGLTISKSVSPDTKVKSGDTVTYTIKVTNNTGKDLTDIKVSEKLDASLTYESSEESTGQYDSGNGVWTIGSLANKGVATLTLKAVVKEGTADGTVIKNTVTVTEAKDGEETLPEDKKPEAGAEVTVESPDTPPTPIPAEWDKLTISKTVDKTSVTAGDTVTYTIKVSNSTGKDLTDIRISEKLNENLIFDGAEPSDQYDPAKGIWSIDKLANGDTAVLTIKVKIKEGVKSGTVIKNTVTITDAEAGSDDRLPDGDGPNDGVELTVKDSTAIEPTKPNTSDKPNKPDEPSKSDKPNKSDKSGVSDSTNQTKQQSKEAVRTGDTNHVHIWMILMAVSLLGMAGFFFLRRKNRDFELKK